MKRIVSRIGVSALLLSLVCVVSSCRENVSFSNIDSESVQQIQDANFELDKNISVTVDSAQSTQVIDADMSSEKTIETTPKEATQNDAEQHTEILEDGRVNHTFHLVDNPELFSIAVPPSWKRGVDSFSETFISEYMTKDSKRMGVSKQQGMTEDQWVENHADYEGPLTGITTKGYKYIGYYRDPQIEKDVNWRIYYFLIIPDVGTPHSVSIYHNLDKDPEDYLDTVVIPAIESVIIE